MVFLRKPGHGSQPDEVSYDIREGPEGEAAGLAAVGPRLTPNAFMLSDNDHATDALMRWAEQSGR
jgi:hypothetical protein